MSSTFDNQLLKNLHIKTTWKQEVYEKINNIIYTQNTTQTQSEKGAVDRR